MYTLGFSGAVLGSTGLYWPWAVLDCTGLYLCLMGDMGNMGDMSKEVKDGDKECHTCEREQMEGEEESGK